MTKEVLVSVIIPVRNAERYLPECLRSVLAQNFQSFEVIVVDNNSADQTKEIISALAKDYQNLKYVFEPEKGRGAARNTGEKIARGKVILMTDADCVVPENWIKDMAEPILSGEAEAVQGSERGIGDNFWSRQIDIRIEERMKYYASGREDVKVDTKNFAIKRGLLESMGGTSRWFESGNDTDLGIRLLKRKITPFFKGDVRVSHRNPASFAQFIKKQFWRAFWCHRITRTHLVFLRQTNFLEETDQTRKPIGRSIKNIFRTLKKNGAGYLFFDLVAMLFWRAGLFYAERKPWETANLTSRDWSGDVTAIIPIINRYDYRIRNCLKSLRRQTYNRDLLQIILVDYGSDEKYKIDFENLCREFGARGVWMGASKEDWSKAKCVNVGLKNTKTKYALIVDLDSIFEDKFIETCVAVSREVGRPAALYPRMMDTPRGLIRGEVDTNDYQKFLAKSSYRGNILHGNFPYGVCTIFAETAVFLDMGGFDENYTLWGYEDIDMAERLENSGVEVLSLQEWSSMIHQWHPRFEGVKLDRTFEEQVRLNRQYFEINFAPVRNQILQKAESPQKLPGSIWGITCIFNPAGYGNKADNFRIFREASRKQGLKLVAVELAFGDEPFELNQNDADILIQRRGGPENIMWQKEALLNLALKHLPADCDKVVWIDADVMFADDAWLEKTAALLDKYKVVHPFAEVVRMRRGTKSPKEQAEAEAAGEIPALKPGLASIYHLRRNEILSDTFDAFVTGFVVAGRRETLEKIGFFDRAIIGSGDAIMIKAFFGFRHFTWLHKIPARLLEAQNNWARRAFQEVGGSVGFLPNRIFHLWHGEPRNRRYWARNKVFRNRKFNPAKEVILNASGILEWATDDEALKAEVAEYFFIRNEEGQTRMELGLDMRKIKRKMKKILFLDLGREYYEFLGAVGRKIRANNEGLYFFLKKYFPDKN